MKYVQQIAQGCKQRRRELAEAITLEMGKPVGESLAEVDRGVAEMEFAAGEALRTGGQTLPSARPNLSAYTLREPLSVVAAITPWNFPFVSPVRKALPALAYGCTVVLKPASQTPLPAVILAEVTREAGLPAGVFNLIIGRGGEVGDALITHPAVEGITFTGSTEVGLDIASKAASRNARIQLEMGGKNGCVVARCADLDAAAAQIVGAAFQASGQRCTAISRVIVLQDQSEEFEAALAAHANELRVGHGLDDAVTMGPLSSQAQLERSLHYIDLALEDGARVIAGGRRMTGGEYDEGYYLEPTILGGVEPGTAPALDEIFGPVLVILPAGDFDEALSIHNEVRYGLSASIFTDDMELAQRFVHGAGAGMVHVNNGTVSEPHLPFGGVKQSGMGAYSIGSTNAEFYTKLKVVYHQH
jgi:acyl-CoA reductase-like NAD-dependent aldehyde dehydrogenase